jgi:hypothetical protein
MQRGIGGVARDGAVALGRIATTALVVAAGCSDSNSTSPTSVATSITANSTTNGQTGAVGTPLALPLSVLVDDQSGAPLSNASVTWTVVSGGGSVASSTSTTDASGTATILWTLGPTVGVDSVKGTIGNGTSVTFTATATVGPVSALRITSGGSQSVAAGATTAPLVVQVIDQFANPIANATVTWAVQGGGSLSASSSTTDATGTAQVTLTTDPAPTSYTVTAATGNITPVTFSITSM